MPYDEAIEQARILLELDPAGYAGHHAAGQCYGAKGMFAEAIAAHRRAVELSGGAPWVLGWLGLGLAQTGQTAEALAVFERLRPVSRDTYVPPTSFAWIQLGVGHIDDAFVWMERAVDGRDPLIMPI